MGLQGFRSQGKLITHQQTQGEDEGHLRNFIDCVRSRKAPNAEIEVGFRSVVHCHLANMVARTGRTLRYDGKSNTVSGDPAAARLVSREYRDHWSKPRGV